jgi:hypothetical protein
VRRSIQLQASLAALLMYSTLFTGCSFFKSSTPPLVTTYKTLVATQAAVQVIRDQASAAKECKDQINKVIAAYNVAEASFQAVYAGVGGNTDQSVLNANVAILVSQVALLVSQFAPKAQAMVKPHATAVTAKINLDDILTILSIAAAAAGSIPGASPFAALAQIIIQAAAQGKAAYSSAGNTIVPSMLHTIELLA